MKTNSMPYFGKLFAFMKHHWWKVGQPIS